MKSDFSARLVFVGGDTRMMYAARELAGRGFDVCFAARDAGAAALRLAEAGFADLRAADAGEVLGAISTDGALVLPLPASRDGVCVWDSVIGESPTVAGVFAALSPGARVFCGMARASVTDAAREARAELVDYCASEGFLIANAALTAEGAIAELVRLSPCALLRSRGVIFGYGRCASQLARRLVALGSRVTVVARRADRREAAKADGADAVAPTGAASVCAGADFAVNTVPAPVIGASEAAALAASGAFVLELADRPGVAPEAAGLVPIYRAAGLPGRYSPRSAGTLIADAIGEALCG